MSMTEYSEAGVPPENTKHAERALEASPNEHISVSRDEEGRANVAFVLQSAPVGEVGVQGCQAVDMLVFVKNLFKSLNDTFPCRENALTITKLEEAIHWQKARTEDRESRGVEGKNEA